MKLRKAIKLATTGAVVSVLPGLANAVVPSITAWELDGAGNVVYTCDATNICSDTPIVDDGFYQVTAVDLESGLQYILTVNAEGAGDGVNPTTFGNMGAGGFADANVIQIGSATGGIHAKSEIEDVDGDVNFLAGAEIASGFAEAIGLAGFTDIEGISEANKIVLSQSVVDSQVLSTPDTFSNVFDYTKGSNTGARYDGTWSITSISGSTNDNQTFSADFASKQLVMADVTTGTASTTAGDAEYKQIIQSAVLNDPTITQVFTMKELTGVAGLTAGGSIDPVNLALALGADPATFTGDELQFSDLRIDQTGTTGTFGKELILADGVTLATFDSLIQTGPFYNITPDPFVK